MAVIFLADIEDYTTESVWMDEWVEDPGTPEEVVHPEGWSATETYRRPAFDRTGIASWVMVELRNGKCLVRATGIDTTPADAQSIGAVTKTTIVDTQLAIKIRDYFSLTIAEGQAAVGKMFGEVIYILMLVKPAIKDGRRTLILGEVFHEVTA